MKDVQPKTNLGDLLRYRDSICAADLLICAVAYFDFFTLLRELSATVLFIWMPDR